MVDRTYIARRVKVGVLTSEDIPEDFSQVMEYFNRDLAKRKFPYIPRKKKITAEEIRGLWLPSLSRNICFIAENVNLKQVVGSATVLYDVDSNDYEHSSLRKPGELALTVDSGHDYLRVGSKLLGAIIRDLVFKGKKAVAHTDVDFEQELEIFEELGFNGESINDYERYKLAGLSGRVFEFELP